MGHVSIQYFSCNNVSVLPLLRRSASNDGVILKSELEISRSRLAVWLSGNASASINVVALRQTRLVLGWVTVCGRVNHLGM